MITTRLDQEWLIELLSQNKFIDIHDGLGTFLHKTNEGWRICGRDDVISLLKKEHSTTFRLL